MNTRAAVSLVAVLSIGVVALLVAAANGGPAIRKVPVHEGSTTYVWHMQDADVRALTMYAYSPAHDCLIKRHYVLEQGSQAFEIPEGGSYELLDANGAQWSQESITNGVAYTLTQGSGQMAVRDAAKKVVFEIKNLPIGSRVLIAGSTITVFRHE